MNCDVLIIGAGIVGCAVAESCARRGLRVMVVEAGVPAAGTTAAGMGHLVVLDGSPAELALSLDGVRRWQARRAELPRETEYRATGTLWLARTEAEMGAAAHKEALYRSQGIASSLLTPTALARLEPWLGNGFVGALRVQDDAVLYPPRAAAYLLDNAQSHGAMLLRQTSVTTLTDDGQVQLADGRVLRAARVVVAAGCQSVALLPDLPLKPRKGQLIITERYPRCLSHQLVELGYLQSAHANDGSSVAFNVQPRATGQLLIGSSRSDDVSPEIDWPLLSQMLARALDYLPWLANLQGLRAWTGFRPSTPDKLPLLGRYRAGSAIWLATGHEGLGITTALASAELLAALLHGEAPTLDPMPYDPARFLTAAADCRNTPLGVST